MTVDRQRPGAAPPSTDDVGRVLILAATGLLGGRRVRVPAARRIVVRSGCADASLPITRPPFTQPAWNGGREGTDRPGAGK